MEIVLKNNRLRVVVDTYGAEITKVENFTDGETVKDCVWDGNPRWWKRHTPVLFPIVGSLWHGVMRHNGCEYAMSQHGFARDSEFEVVAALCRTSAAQPKTVLLFHCACQSHSRPTA